MGVYDSYLKERKTSGSSVYSQYQKELSGNTKSTQSLLPKLVNSLVVNPITKMAEVFQKPPTPKGWKLAFGSEETAKRTWDTWSSTIDDTSRRLNGMMDAYTKPDYKSRFILNAGVKTAGAGVGLINSAFAGVTGLINSLTPVPVVGHVADSFNKLFEAVGVGSASVALDALYASPLDEDTKTKLEPVVGELAGLIGMAIAGKATHSTYTGIKERSAIIFDSMKKVDPTRTVPVQSGGETTTFGTTRRTGNIRVQNAGDTSGKIQIENKAGEYYPPVDKLPVIQFGGGNKDVGLPTIQTGVPKSRRVEGDFIYEPLQETVVPNTKKSRGFSVNAGPRSETKFTYKPTQENRQEIIANKIIEKEAGIVTEETRSPEYTRFQSETALKLRRDAAEKGYTLTEDVPFQKKMNMMENLKTADEYVASDPVRAERALARNERFPNDIQPGSVWKSLKARALRDGDIPLMERLSRMTPGTEAGRNIKSFDEMVKTEADPVEAIREVRAAKAEAKKVDVAKEVKKVKQKLKKEPITKESWDDFIKGLEC